MYWLPAAELESLSKTLSVSERLFAPWTQTIGATSERFSLPGRDIDDIGTPACVVSDRVDRLEMHDRLAREIELAVVDVDRPRGYVGLVVELQGFDLPGDRDRRGELVAQVLLAQRRAGRSWRLPPRATLIGQVAFSISTSFLWCPRRHSHSRRDQRNSQC